jgi:uncharacterized protein (TIGR03066 family)
MNALRLAVVGCLLLGLTVVARAEKDDKDADTKAKLVGKWEPTKSKDLPQGAVVEVTKDGKMFLTAKMGDKELKLEGTYTVKGDKLKMTFKQGGQEMTQTVTIKKLTDTVLITVDEKGETDEFKKKK